MVDRYQEHEIPQVACGSPSTTSTRWRARCGRTHTAARPEGARPGPVGYGPNLAAFAVYLMVVHFVPAHRVVALLESLTGAAPSVGFVHGLLARTAGLLGAVHDRIRSPDHPGVRGVCDETPLKVGPRTPRPGKIKAERYLLVACTELYTHYLLGDRSLETFKASCSPSARSAARWSCTTATRTTTRPSSPGWSTSCAARTYCVILTTPPRSTPRPSGPARSPRRCAS